MQNDFTLIELKEELNFTLYPRIRPICLPEDDDEDFVGATAWLTGWHFKYGLPRVCIILNMVCLGSVLF